MVVSSAASICPTPILVLVLGASMDTLTTCPSGIHTPCWVLVVLVFVKVTVYESASSTAPQDTVTEVSSIPSSITPDGAGGGGSVGGDTYTMYTVVICTIIQGSISGGGKLRT